MSGADLRFHQYRASAQNSPANSKPSSRAASPVSSKPTSRRSSRSEDAKKLAKAMSTNEWNVPGLYSNSKPSSRSNSRRNSLSEKSKHNLKASEIVINKEDHLYLPANDEHIIDSEEIKKALTTIEWKAPGVYSNPSSASNSRRNSLVGKSSSNNKTSNGHDNESFDATEIEKALNKAM